MRAIVITRAGGPEVLEVRDVAPPVPASREILVRVHATAVNRADLMQAAGSYPAPDGIRPDIPGLEYAGVVAATAPDATRWRTGDRVMGIVGGASFAEFLVTHEDEAMPVPGHLDLTAAAAVPEAFATAHDAMFTQMRLQPGETVLVHAVGSGVGTAALQLAKAHGAAVIGTQRNASKLDQATSLGLDLGIDTSSADFADAVMAHTDGRGVDGILDLVGGPYIDGDLRCIALRGRIMMVGLVAGARHELDMRRLLNRRATITGTVLRARSRAEKVEVARALTRDVLPLLDSGAVRPVVDRTVPLEDAAHALRVVASNSTFGKVVLTVS